MRSRQVTEWIGERVGDIDYSYDFRKHFDSIGTTDERKDERCREKVALLRRIEELFKQGKELEVCSSGGYWHRLIDVGMYDGWPFWKPTPSVFRECAVKSWGGEWDTFSNVQDVRERKP